MFEVFMFIVITLIVSIAIDLTYGELPTKIHPVVIISSQIHSSNKNGSFTILLLDRPVETFCKTMGVRVCFMDSVSSNK